MDEFTFDANFESAAARRDEFHGFDPSHVANFSRQTDGPRLVVSDRAVFNRDVCFHVILLPPDPIARWMNGSSRRVCEGILFEDSSRNRSRLEARACLEGLEPPTF